MSNYGAFGSGFMDGVNAINSIYDRRDKKRQRKEDVAHRDRMYGLDERKVKAMEAQSQTHSDYYKSGAEYNRYKMNQDQTYQMVSELNAMLHSNPEALQSYLPKVAEHFQRRFPGEIGPNKRLVGFEPVNMSPLTEYDRELQRKGIPNGLIPKLAVQDGKGGERPADMTVKRSSNPQDPPRAYSMSAFGEYLLNNPGAEELRQVTDVWLKNQQGRRAKSGTGQPVYPYKIDTIRAWDPTANEGNGGWVQRSIRRWPDGQEQPVEMNQAGDIIPYGGSGAGNVVDEALKDLNTPAPAANNPGATQAPPPPDPDPNTPQYPPQYPNGRGTVQPYGR